MTIDSCWVNANGRHLFGVWYFPEKVQNHICLLISGLSSPMCDVDYFMSRLARRLCENGNIVFQIDLSGIGDSSGDLVDVSIESLKEDIESVISYIIKYNVKEVFIISRGFISIIVEEITNKSFLDAKKIAISPYQPSTDYNLNSINEIEVDYNHLCSIWTNQQVDLILEGIGIKPSNLKGQKISLNLLRSISQYTFSDISNSVNSQTFLFKDSTYFTRNALLQNTMINDICEYIKNYTE